MSKAFTKESDESGEDPLPIPRALPPGVINLITAAGALQLRQELADSLHRKQLLANSSAEANESSQTDQRKLQARIRQLQQILQSVVVAEPPADRGLVGFGARVTVRHANNEEFQYRIVGVDESDPARDQISWLCPLAKQLTGQRAGDRVQFRSPAGEEELEIVAVAYE